MPVFMNPPLVDVGDPEIKKVRTKLWIASLHSQ